MIASARSDFADSPNRLRAVNIVLGDLVLVTRQIEGGLEVRHWLRQISGEEPGEVRSRIAEIGVLQIQQGRDATVLEQELPGVAL